MKKFLCLFLVLALSMLSLLGCSNAATNDKSNPTTTHPYTSDSSEESNEFRNFVDNCINFIDTGEYTIIEGYPPVSSSNYNVSGIDAAWINSVVDELNNYILSIPESKRPYFYTVELLKDDKFFQITIEKSSNSDLEYYFDSWAENIGNVYVYVSNVNLYKEIHKELNTYISSLSTEKQSIVKEKINLTIIE